MFAKEDGESTEEMYTRLERHLRKCHTASLAAQITLMGLNSDGIPCGPATALAVLMTPDVAKEVTLSAQYDAIIAGLKRDGIDTRLERLMDKEGHTIRYELKIVL